jgi:hypothetical protein
MNDEKQEVVRWQDRDRSLEAKLKRLYGEHLDSWIQAQGDRKFEQKWHVGREMLDWFYANKLLDADEYEALHVRHSRPSKPRYDIEMYRIVWISSGRASDQVAAVSLAPRTGPSPGYKRAPARLDSADSEQGRGGDAQRELRRADLPSLEAEREVLFGVGGWLYCYGYEEALRYSAALGEDPLIKVGHTTGNYQDRIRMQVRGTAVPDSPKVLRAYRVADSGVLEGRVHRTLKDRGLHHRRAGGAKWFRVRVEVIDDIVASAIDVPTNAA